MDSTTIVLVSGLSVASQIFGPWEPIKVSEITKNVPEYVHNVAHLGAVHKYQRGDQIGCPLTENGKTVGWSLACK